jgi:hypothetical protein
MKRRDAAAMLAALESAEVEGRRPPYDVATLLDAAITALVVGVDLEARALGIPRLMRQLDRRERRHRPRKPRRPASE